MSSRVKPQRLTPVLEHIPHIFVKKFKQPDAQGDEQSRLKKFEYRDDP
jgi:hypothetical protein